MSNRLSSGPEGAHLDRLTTIQNNVRSMLLETGTQAGSSIYERSPMLGTPQVNSRPRPSPQELFGQVRQQTRSNLHAPSLTASSLHLPLNLPGPSMAMEYSPATAPSEWSRLPEEPAPVASPAFRHPADIAPAMMNEERDLEAAVPPPRSHTRGQKKRRKRRQRQTAWVRQNGQRGGRSSTCVPLAHGHTRMKFMACVISGLFLASILTIYLTLVLTLGRNIPQELHILFILTIIGTTIFFAHSLIRLWIMAQKSNPSRSRTHHNRIPSTAGPEGFKPNVPIPVQLARDEEIAALDEDGMITEEKLEALKAPPPAYGLWRCSVRIDPNLLHWQRVQALEEAEATRQALSTGNRSMDSLTLATNFPSISPRLGVIDERRLTVPRREEGQQVREGQPRPPSYVSDDGVSYVVSALPGRPPSEIHPALRVRLP